jgi:hypothetical protein
MGDGRWEIGEHEKPKRKERNFPLYRAQRVRLSEAIQTLFIGKRVFG